MIIRGFNGKNKLRRNMDYSNEEKIKVKEEGSVFKLVKWVIFVN